MSMVMKRIKDSYAWKRFRSSPVFPIALILAVVVIAAYGIFPTGAMAVILSAYLVALIVLFGLWDKKHRPPRKKHQRKSSHRL